MPESNTQTVVNQSRFPPELAPYYDWLAASSMSAAAQPYTPYGGQRLAGYTPTEQVAQMGLTQFGQAGPPDQVTDATNFARSSGSSMANLYAQLGQDAQGGWQGLASLAGQFGPLGERAGQIGAQGQGEFQNIGRDAASYDLYRNTDMQPYMSPYIQNVLKARERAVLNDGRRGIASLKSNAAQSGAFGGYRHGVLEGEVMKDVNQRVDDVYNTGMQDALMNAQGMFVGDRDAGFTSQGQRIAAQQGANQSAQWGLGTQMGAVGQQLGGLQAAENNLLAGRQQQFNTLAGLGSLSGQLANLGGMEQALTLERLNTLQNVGMGQRAMQQASMDMGYQDFLNQRNYPQQQLGWFGGILNALPQQPTQQISTFQQQPGLWQSTLGTGIAGLGLYNTMQNQQAR